MITEHTYAEVRKAVIIRDVKQMAGLMAEVCRLVEDTEACDITDWFASLYPAEHLPDFNEVQAWFFDWAIDIERLG